LAARVYACMHACIECTQAAAGADGSTSSMQRLARSLVAATGRSLLASCS
jgi:hypothetical protein